MALSFTEGKFNIPDDVIDEVTFNLGVPILDLQDMQLSKERVLSIAIKPAMRLYFSYYPLVLKKEYPISGQVDIPFPDDNVFSVSQARVAVMNGGVRLTKNPVINQSLVLRGSSSRSYGRTPYGRDPYQSMSLHISEHAESMSYMNLTKAGNFNVDIEERRLWGYSNVQGTLIVNWARFSRNWSSIRFDSVSDVIDVAKMYILRYVGDIREQLDANTGVTSNASNFLSRADAIETKILDEKWKARVPVIVMH